MRLSTENFLACTTGFQLATYIVCVWLASRMLCEHLLSSLSDAHKICFVTTEVTTIILAARSIICSSVVLQMLGLYIMTVIVTEHA